MYFTTLPDHRASGFNEALHFSKFRKHNIIFHAGASNSHCARHVGCLSIKTVLRGEEWYDIGNHHVAVRPGQFLILNDDQEYSCRVNTPTETKVLSVFFAKEFAASVFHDALHSNDTLLDNPFESGGHSLEFFQTLYDTDRSLKNKLLSLTHSLKTYGYEANTVSEHLVFLLHHLIHTHKAAVHRTGQVPAVKPGTRLEIYKRICVVKDILHSNYMEKPNLSDMSKAACISVPQLIRHFRAVFQVTPYQYLTQIRLTHAAHLLTHTLTPVHEITWMCGFENVSAFCRAFKSEYGVQPLSFRKRSR